ncbi:hypothetical protein P280DRAFT_512008 [Massarina eburnea CBS 473.64]|uniref:Uncharacterized protein n=1 Tax=Massarina eburnea CBS 473.64 TaxID=1395130 RepID=A0A6A6RFS6_9PLEO|nr:hypothetical protein P280DRAFT_512008 [Massarina eburnea CBS 473.64]
MPSENVNYIKIAGQFWLNRRPSRASQQTQKARPLLKQSSRVSGSQTQRKNLHAHKRAVLGPCNTASTGFVQEFQPTISSSSALPSITLATPSTNRNPSDSATTEVARPGHPHKYDFHYEPFTEQVEFSLCRCMTPERHGNAFALDTPPDNRDKAHRAMTWEEMHNKILNVAREDVVSRVSKERSISPVNDAFSLDGNQKFNSRQAVYLNPGTRTNMTCNGGKYQVGSDPTS